MRSLYILLDPAPV